MAFESDDDKTQNYVALPLGSSVSHYKLIEKIGSGGMGEVYLAEDTKLKRQVALKFLPVQFAADQDYKARFTREAQASARLSHPNVIHIYEVSEHQGRPFFAMELVEGRSLGNVLRSQRLSFREILDMAVQICAGLNEAHEAEVVHRDIKPANILINKKGQVKIVDFGLATITGSEQLTSPGSLLGTVGYMSPEQVKGDKTDHRSDIFSVGVVLYEMLTGQQPFLKDSKAATLYAIVNESPSPVAQSKVDVPEKMQRIVNKALEKDPAVRYQCIGDLLADLRRLKEDMRENDQPSPLRRQLPWLVVSLAVVLLLLNPTLRRAGLRWLGFGAVPTQKHLVVLPFTNVGEVQASQAFCDGLMETLTSKLTQLEQFQGSLWVVPASEVRDHQVLSARQARGTFGATLVVSGSVQRLDSKVRTTLNLVDAKTERQLRSSLIEDSLSNVSALQDSTVINLARMLEVELQPAQRRYLTAGGTTVPEAYDFYLQGRGYLQHYEKVENIDTAIGLFRQALGEDSLYAQAYAGLGKAYWYKYKTIKEPKWIEYAQNNCQLAIELNKQQAPLHVTMGLIHAGTGQYEEAVREFRQALELDSVNHDAYVGLAATYEALNELEKAEATYQRIIELKPDYWTGNLDLGLFYIKHGRSKDALKQLHKVARLEPEGFIAWNNLGGLYFYLDRLADARNMFERSLEIETNYGAYANLGTIYHTEGHYAGAARMYEKALELDDHDYQVWGNLASAYYWMPGQRKEALAAYRRAAQMAEKLRLVNPRNAEVLSDLGEYYAMLSERPRALPLIELALSLAPDDVDVMISAGVVYEQLGDRETALEWIEKALGKGFPISQLESLPELQHLLADPRLEIPSPVSNNNHRRNEDSER